MGKFLLSSNCKIAVLEFHWGNDVSVSHFGSVKVFYLYFKYLHLYSAYLVIGLNQKFMIAYMLDLLTCPLAVLIYTTYIFRRRLA